MVNAPRVTVGIATYDRDAYLAEAIESCLDQDYQPLEVLVVMDGSTNPRIDEIVGRYERDPRLRAVRHDRNRGIAAAYNTFVEAGRGELIAMLGDDDVSLPGRIRRQVEVFDRFPETGVVHGDGTIIDGRGTEVGRWPSRDFSPAQLLHAFFFSHNHLVDPTRMVHRRVYEQIGGYDDRYPLANDLDFWLRAAPRFRFRHCPGGPLTAIRRHGENTSDEAAGRVAETADVEAILRGALERISLRELVPEIDWAVLDPAQAERDALLRLAAGVETRGLPLPGLAAELRERAELIPAAKRPQPRSGPNRPHRLLMTAFGWSDAGGGTTVPRIAAKELVRRGWEVTVFHAAVGLTPTRIPYETLEWEEDGVQLVGVHNRPHGIFDLGHPQRELDDPPITALFEAALDRVEPEVVHFHNLHNLGSTLIDQVAARGLPAYFTTHNYWLICPRAYLLTGNGSLCAGPGDGARCAACVASTDTQGHRERLAAIRARAHSGLTRILAVSDAVRLTLESVGYDPALIDVVRQAMPHEQEIWERVGRDRRPGPRREDALTVAFVGSAYPHKGPQLLVQAAQLTQARLNVRIVGEISDEFAAGLRQIDQRGVVELHGSFAPSELGELLRDIDVAVLPSMWWDCAPLVAAECLAARVPLVVPRLGGLPEAVRDGVDGLVFTGLDAGDLAAKLDRLVGEPGLLERMQASISEPRAFAAYVDELEAYYDGQLRPAVKGSAPVAVAPVQVRWQGDFGLKTSLSIVNDEVTSRLPHSLQRLDRASNPLDGPLSRAADVEVHHGWPPDLTVPQAGRLAAIVPWEFGSIPERWLSDISHNVDALWVPSEFVRSMYINDGVAPERVHVIPNGVDLEVFRPGMPEERVESDQALRFLYVGGITHRKGPDILLRAWQQAFAGRKDVVLVVKAAMAGGAYGGPNDALRERARSELAPRVDLIEDDLEAPELAALYRSCDVFVHPYRGEGFAMPVLEAMASGLPVITTAGGPTDEFCPPEAGWRIDAQRLEMSPDDFQELRPHGQAWMLEPDWTHLVDLLREAAADGDQRHARGRAARHAAERLSWRSVSQLYEDQIQALRLRAPLSGRGRPEPFPLTADNGFRLLATPAWKGRDRLVELLREWSEATDPDAGACLYLLADPAAAGTTTQVEDRVLDAAAQAGVELDACGDVEILFEPFQPERDVRLHAAVDAYVPIHPACAGHARLAAAAGNPCLNLGQLELELSR